MDGTGGTGRNPLDLLVPDLTGHPPMCGEEEFTRRMAAEVAGARARAFAVVQEYGTRAAMEIAGWGIAVGGRYDVIGVGSGQWLGMPSSESVRQGFTRGDRVRAHVVPADGTQRSIG